MESICKRVKLQNKEQFLNCEYDLLRDKFCIFIQTFIGSYSNEWKSVKELFKQSVKMDSLPDKFQKKLRNVDNMEKKLDILFDNVVADLEDITQYYIEVQRQMFKINPIGFDIFMKKEMERLEEQCVHNNVTENVNLDILSKKVKSQVYSLPNHLKNQVFSIIVSPIMLQIKKCINCPIIDDMQVKCFFNEKLVQNLFEIDKLIKLQLEQLILAVTLFHKAAQVTDETSIGTCADTNGATANDECEEGTQSKCSTSTVIKGNYETSTQSICHFFVDRKKRFCRMLAAEGKDYCGQHLVADQTSHVS